MRRTSARVVVDTPARVARRLASGLALRDVRQGGEVMKAIDLRSYDEPALCKIVEWVLSPVFEIQREVCGKNLTDGEKVRIDFILHPKQSLRDRGFDAETVGIEVKSPFSKNVKQNAFAWQSVTYAQSEFDGARPDFVLMFPDVTHFWPDTTAFSMQSFLQYANVGMLLLGRDQHMARQRWCMKFGSTRYFSMDRGVSEQPNAATKRRWGNCS